MRLIIGVAALLSLTACESPWNRLPDVQREVTVTDVNPPKRLYVTLRDDQNGQTYEGIYVSKRCSSYERVPVGSRFTQTFHVYQHKETGEISVEADSGELYQRFCA